MWRTGCSFYRRHLGFFTFVFPLSCLHILAHAQTKLPGAKRNEMAVKDRARKFARMITITRLNYCTLRNSSAADLETQSDQELTGRELLISMISVMEQQGYNPGEGNCQFDIMSPALSRFGIH